MRSATYQEPLVCEPWYLEHLHPFPVIALRLLRTLAVEDVEIAQVCGVIKADPAFAGQLLQAANSPLFGHSYNISSIERAATAVGLDYLTKLAMTIALRTYLRKALTTLPAQRCWHHSLATALISAELSFAYSQQRDNAYTAGLIHDIGRLALIRAFPSGYTQMVEVCEREHIDILDAERAMLGSDHCTAGLWVSVEWKLPTESYRVIWDHHDSPEEDERSLTALVHTACGLADRLGFGILPVTAEPQDIVAGTPKCVRCYVEQNLARMGAELPEKVRSLAQG